VKREELRGLGYVTLAVGLFATTPVLIRWAAPPLSPFEVTFGRMATAAVAVLLLARLQAGRPSSTGPRSPIPAPRFLLYGLIAALHFLLYIASLSYTTIAHSLALVYTAPVFVTLFTSLLLKEQLRPRQWLGIPVVVAGIGVLAGFEPRMDARMAFGDVLAVGSAVCFGLYSVAGRRERTAYPLLEYAGAVYLAAALWLLPAAALGGTGTLTWRAVAAVVALGVCPLAVGHTLYNASLRRVHPTYVNLIATQEVTGGIILGYLLLGEAPGAGSLIGAGLSLAGVALVLLL
jgi:drug/metabolite transporter (DMT)-like permease